MSYSYDYIQARLEEQRLEAGRRRRVAALRARRRGERLAPLLRFRHGRRPSGGAAVD